MESFRHPETAARHALRVCGLLVTLAGLFGMHGLDSHGAAGTETIPQAVMAEGSMSTVAMGTAAVTAELPSVAHLGASAMDHAEAAVSDAATAATAVVTSTVVASGHGGMDMGVAEMCMAILALALIALLRLLVTNRTRRVLWMVARPARAPAPSGRDPDPPSLINLSIQRC